MTKNNLKEDFDDRVVEIEDSDPGVAPSKGGKTMFIVGIILAVAMLINFFVLPLFSGGEAERKSQEIVVADEESPVEATNIVNDVDIADTFTSPIIDDTFADSFDVPSVPELPELPELSEEVAQNIENVEKERQQQEEEFQKRLADERARQEEANQALEQKIQELESRLSTTKTSQQEAIIKPRTSTVAPTVVAPTVTSGLISGIEDEGSAEYYTKRKKELEQRKNAGLVMQAGTSGPKSSFVDGGGIILSQENTVRSLEESTIDVTAQRVKDLKTTILQGKLIYAVLETAINTDFEGTLRGIVTRDVYAEKGSHVLISKGSRLIGTYEAGITRGQNRLMINWNRIIRTDGVEIAINSQTTDQFGRSGLQGAVDNKYVEVLGNSLLTSILSVATAIATEEVTNSTGVGRTTSTDSGSSTQTTGKASDFAIIDATESFLQTAEDLVEDLSESAKPTMRIPQGTKLLVFVNQDLSIPPIEE